MKKLPLLCWLFGINFFISAFTFGGGYIVIPMIRKYFVQNKNLLCESELLDMAAIAQSSPGAIAVNLSVLAGYKTAGLKGAIISGLASVLPALLILSVISAGYQAFRDNTVVSAVLKGMEAGVAALIVDLVYDMCRNIFKEGRLFFSILIPLAFIASFFLQINAALIIAASALLCLLECFIRRNEVTV